MQLLTSSRAMRAPGRAVSPSGMDASVSRYSGLVSVVAEVLVQLVSAAPLSSREISSINNINCILELEKSGI